MAAPNVAIPNAPETKAPAMRIVEISVDGKNTVIRRLVPATTHEDDVPERAILLGERESAGILERAAKPAVLEVGVPVGYASAEYGDIARLGTVEAKLRSGKFRIAWADGMKETCETKQLLVRY